MGAAVGIEDGGAGARQVLPAGRRKELMDVHSWMCTQSKHGGGAWYDGGRARQVLCTDQEPIWIVSRAWGEGMGGGSRGCAMLTRQGCRSEEKEAPQPPCIAELQLHDRTCAVPPPRTGHPCCLCWVSAAACPQPPARSPAAPAPRSTFECSVSSWVCSHPFQTTARRSVTLPAVHLLWQF